MTTTRTALDRAIAEMPARAHATNAAVTDAAVVEALMRPWKIARAVYAVTNPMASWTWPVEGKTTLDVLADCRRRIAVERSLPAHYADANRLRGVIHAEAALLAMVMTDAPKLAATLEQKAA